MWSNLTHRVRARCKNLQSQHTEVNSEISICIRRILIWKKKEEVIPWFTLGSRTFGILALTNKVEIISWDSWVHNIAVVSTATVQKHGSGVHVILSLLSGVSTWVCTRHSSFHTHRGRPGTPNRPSAWARGWKVSVCDPFVSLIEN